MTPNLFLVGAPKCGTSSLFDWLLEHPAIRGCRVKEPFFLIDPAHPLARTRNVSTDGLEGYADLFDFHDANAPVRMEGTTHYLFDPHARQHITALPDARVIILLREPAARVYSSFQFTANNLARLNPRLSFDRYLQLVEAGDSLAPLWCNHRGSAWVLERDILYSKYADHVGPWLATMAPERLKLVVMEQMLRDPDALVGEIIEWLGLDVGQLVQFDSEARNRTENVRLPQIHALARGINARIQVPKATRSLIKRVYGAVQFRQRQPIDIATVAALERLRAGYAAGNEELARMTGLDLSTWSVASASGAIQSEKRET